MAEKDSEPVNNFGSFRRGSAQPHRRGGTPHGRYDHRQGKAWSPADDLARMPVSRNSDATVGAVEDPYGDGKQRILVTVNRRTDILEQERSHGRIGEAAYCTGREVQAALEYVGRIGGTNWAGASRKDPAEVRDTHAQRLIDDGERARAMVGRLRDRLGMIDTRLLAAILASARASPSTPR